MNATQVALVIKQLFLVGPLALSEVFPQIGIPIAFFILLLSTAFLFIKFTPNRATNLFAIVARLLVSWVFSSSLMIIVAYLKA